MIDSHDDLGGSSTVKIEGDHARIDSSDDSGYMLVDMQAGKFFSVSIDDRMVIDTSAPVTPAADTPAAGPAVQAALAKVGAGPTIAGYATVQYRVTADGQTCYDEYLAPALLKDRDIKRFLSVMRKWSDDQRRVASSDEDECDAAESAISDQYATLGMPMRTVDGAGTVVHEVTRIRSSVKVPSSVFATPKQYQTVSEEDLMQRMRDSSDKDGGGDPDQLEELQQDMQDMMDRMQGPE